MRLANSYGFTITAVSIVFAAFMSIGIFCTPAPKPESVEKSAFLDMIDTHLVFVAFGYPGCDDVCPRIMARYREYRSAETRPIPLVMVNLIHGMDGQIIRQYCAGFGALGYQPSSQRELVSLKQQFSEYVSPRMFRRGQYNHRGSIHLLKKSGEGWKLLRTMRDFGPPNQLPIEGNYAQI